MRRSTQWNPFNDVYLLSKFDISSFPMTGDTEIFKLVILLVSSSSKLSQVSQNCPYSFCFTVFGQATVILLSLGKTCHKKQSKPSLFDKNLRTMHRIWHMFSKFLWQNKICIIRIKTQKVLQN